MKNTLQINVGLTTSNNNPVVIHLLLQDLRASGLYTVNSRIALGYWQGAPECTLAAECLFAIPLCHPEAKLAIRASLARVAAQHGQTCIAVLWPDSTGELVPDVGSFDPNQFRPVIEAAKVTACDCLSNVIDACQHNAMVSADNGDKAGFDKYGKLAQGLNSNADSLRAVICPTPAPDVSLSKKAVKEICNAACKFPNGSTKDNLLLTLLSNGIAPEGLLIPGNPEVTSGW